MKKKKTSIVPMLAMVCSLAALILSVVGLAAVPENKNHLIDELYAENAQLREQVNGLEERLDQLMTSVNLRSWTLDVAPWADSTGADVTLTAVPTSYQSSFNAELIVMLNGQQILSEDCRWNGSAFTVTVPVSAADGYSYYCQLSTPAGNQKLALTGPDMADAGIPVYLESSLSAYCNLVVDSWAQDRSRNLVLTGAYAQVQLPRICAVGAAEMETSEVVLRLNDTESARIPIELTPSEVEGSLELTITELQIPMPRLQETDVLELFLEVSLNDGRRLSALGITWHLEKGDIVSAVG